jgi:hypothetical protein
MIEALVKRRLKNSQKALKHHKHQTSLRPGPHQEARRQQQVAGHQTHKKDSLFNA